MDDFGDNEDMWTAIGLSLDIALTFTGIGNVSKLRHFRHLSKLGRVFLKDATLAGSERILALEALSGAAALVELTSSVASIILRYYTDGCTLYIPKVEANINDTNPNGQIPNVPSSYSLDEKKQYEFCKNLDQFLFWAQLASAGTDFISGYMLRKSARKLQQVGIPEDFPASGKQFIDDIADLDGAVVNFLNTIQHTHPNIYNKVSNFANDEDKFAFMFDFKNNPGGLSLIENDIFLLNEWQKFKSDIMHIRKDTKYLMSSKRFSSKAYEIEHITKVKNKRIPPSFDPAAGHGYKNIVDGQILNPSTIGLPSDMSSTIISQRNGHITYRPMWFKIPSDCTQPTIVSANLKEFPIGSGNWYKKKSVNTIWNPSWNEDRIREEIIYLWANKKIARLQKNTNLPPINNIQQNVTLYTSQLTDGTKVELRVNNIANQFNVSYQDIMSYLELKL